jgi:hypothetical protein
VRTENNTHVANAIISLSGSSLSSDTTEADGLFSFQVEPDSSYTIAPFKSNDSLRNNGVTTLDILLMQRHILQIVSLGSPYKIIAGDVNGSGNISTLDIILTRALILGNATIFPSGKLWEFVPDNYVFPDPQNPGTFPRLRTYEKIGESYFGQDFIGIKLGDVNNSWDATVP